MEDRHPTVTAAVVAATLLLLRDDPATAHLVDAAALPAVEAAVRVALPELAFLLDSVPWPVLARAAHAAERIASPGFALHYGLRKHCVRSVVTEAVAAGHEQVVLLGAGFDMLSLALPDRARVFEVDHPRSQAIKRRALATGGFREVDYVPIDLAIERLPESLRRAGVDPRRDTVIAAEGLFMYFDEADIAVMLEDLARYFERRRRLVASFITPDDRGAVRLHSQRRIVDWCMRRLGESFAYGASVPAILALLAAHGWSGDHVASTERIGERLAPNARSTRTGEIIVTCASAPS